MNNTRRPYIRRKRQTIRVVKQKAFKNVKEALDFLEEAKKLVIFSTQVNNSTISYYIAVFKEATLHSRHHGLSVKVKVLLNGKEIVLEKKFDSSMKEYNKLYLLSMQRVNSVGTMREISEVVTKMFAELFAEGLLNDRVFIENFLNPMFQ